MPTRESVNELLASLGESLGSPGLALDADDCCVLGTIPGGSDTLVAAVELSLDTESSELALVATLPLAEVTPSLTRTLLEANALYEGPGDDFLALDAGAPCISLLRWVPDPADVAALASELDHFAGSVTSWWDLVSDGEIVEEDQPPPVAPELRA